MLDFEFATTVLYHLRYELLFSALFSIVLLLSPDTWAKLSGKPKPKQKAERKREEAPRDPVELAAYLTELSTTRYGKAMDLFLASEAALSPLDATEYAKVSSALAVASVRVGRADRLPQLFRQLKGLDGTILVHVLRVLASRQQYAEALQCICDWRTAVTPDPAVVPSLAVSCLVQCAVELRRGSEAEAFFALLTGRREAGARDYSAMIRLYAAQSNADAARKTLEEMQAQGMAPDNVAYNMVLAACSSAQQGAEVTSLLAQMDADIVTYNTRLKACTKTKDVAQAFSIYAELQQSPLAPTQVTFGTLLEVCTRAGDLARAREVLAMMDVAGVPKNNIVYTSMIRGLAAAGQLREAMEVFEDMRKHAQVLPDVICYSVLIKGHCDSGDLETALLLLEGLLEAGHAPDEILFNNLLAGCAQKPHVQLGEKLLQDMVSHKIEPTMATFSILLKMYSKAGAFQQSATLLERMPEKYGVVPAPRLYVQHISWCIRLRRGASALQVYRMLLQRCPDARETQLDSFLTSCSSFNMLDTACSLIEIDAARFSVRTIRDLKEVLDKKKKPALAARVQAALRQVEVGARA